MGRGFAAIACYVVFMVVACGYTRNMDNTLQHSKESKKPNSRPIATAFF